MYQTVVPKPTALTAKRKERQSSTFMGDRNRQQRLNKMHKWPEKGNKTDDGWLAETDVPERYVIKRCRIYGGTRCARRMMESGSAGPDSAQRCEGRKSCLLTPLVRSSGERKLHPAEPAHNTNTDRETKRGKAKKACKRSGNWAPCVSNIKEALGAVMPLDLSWDNPGPGATTAVHWAPRLADRRCCWPPFGSELGV